MTSATSSFRLVDAHPVLIRARSWVAHRRRETLGSMAMAVAVLGGFGLIATSAGSIPRTPTPEERVPATVVTQAQAFTPFQVRDIAPDKAVAVNAAVPVDTGPNPAAAPFKAGSTKSEAYSRALECLAQAVYYEAAREPEVGQRAVAQVVLNRVRHPVYPSTVCGVVYQGSERPTGCQFSFTCDGSLYRQPMHGYWDRARRVAHEALQGNVYAPVGNATHYHANYVVPYWASTLDKNAVIATHIFYRWKGGWGQPTAFVQHYSGKEANPYALRTAALAAEARDQARPDVPADVEQAVAQARQELPPELARLVDAEIGPGGEGRVAMRLPADRLAAARKAPLPPRPELVVSSSSNWGLTGQEETAQAPLGRAPAKPAAEATAVAQTKPATTGGEE
jgi:spore germination cell wall hydrolase CwlJ-like protein